MNRLFGTDGVRGVANAELTPELAYRLGRAATIYFGKEDESPLILIGRDTRISGEMLESSLVAGICSAGGSAMLAGVIPTPAVAYLARKKMARAGIVISASHNPFQDNGIKFFGGDGYKLPDSVEDEIEEILHRIEKDDDLYRPTGKGIGRIAHNEDLEEEYVSFVTGTYPGKLDGMRIVLDCANGAAHKVMPEVLRRLGAELIVLNDSPDGKNINDGCGSTHIESLKEAVVREHADFGIAHDGDADRCLCVDEKGEVIDGDHILVICAAEMLKKNNLPGKTVVTTVMANIGFHQAIKKLGARVEVTKVGDRYVLENMVEHGYAIGGEQSGHIIFLEHSTTGDGLITALQVLGAVASSGKKASELNALMVTYPQLLINVAVATKDGWEDNPDIKKAIGEGEKELGETGRILVRASGTEPLIRVMAEGSDEEQLKAVCTRIADVVKKAQG